ncbi:MAG TPA: hypothetical protein VLA71_04300, partial [Algoriphagus sp.]|nr:hypothetical protein [Algoriphagus sp.]
MRKGKVYYKERLAGLIQETADGEYELALSLQGKKRKFKKHDFESLGEGLGLTKRQIERALSRFKDNIEVAKEWINNSFLSEENRGKY